MCWWVDLSVIVDTNFPTFIVVMQTPPTAPPTGCLQDANVADSHVLPMVATGHNSLHMCSQLLRGVPPGHEIPSGARFGTDRDGTVGVDA